MKKFRRSSKDVVLTGLLGGLGEYFEIDPLVVRLFFLFFIFVTGFFPGVLFYFLAHFLIPTIIEVENIKKEENKHENNN